MKSLLPLLLIAPAAFAEETPPRTGLHLTFGMGGAWHQTTSSVDGLDGETERAGFGIAGMGAVGWTLAPGFVLGVGGMGGHIFTPTVSAGGVEAEAKNDLIFMVSGIYADYSFDPAGGLHLQGLLGVATLEEGDDAIEDIALGVGGTLGIGYRWPVSDRWSIGAIGRVQVLATGSSVKAAPAAGMSQVSGSGTADVSNLSVAPALLVGATWH